MSINLDLRHLRVLVSVAASGGYTAAARELHVSQSSVSRTIMDIETALGTQLFERTTRSVVLTVSGEEFVLEARSVLEAFEVAIGRFRLYQRGLSGDVSVAALSSVAATMLPSILSRFRESRPNVRLSVQDGFAGEVTSHVADGRVDFGITASPTGMERLRSEPIAADRFICICSNAHRFAIKESVAWRDLAGEEFVAFDPASSIRTCVDRALQAAGIKLGAITGARDVGAVAGLTAAGLGVSVVPGLVLPMIEFSGVTQKALIDPVIEREICLVCAPERPISPAALDLMDVLRQAAAHGFALPSGARWAQP